MEQQNIWPGTAWRSGKGESRPSTGRAARSNHPLALGPGVNGQSPKGRRHRDLAHWLTETLGSRLKHPGTAVTAGQYISTTLRVEEMQDAVLRGEAINAHTLLHYQQHQIELLKILGLLEPTRNAQNATLHEYMSGSAA